METVPCLICGFNDSATVQEQCLLQLVESQMTTLMQEARTSSKEYERQLADLREENQGLMLNLKHHMTALSYEVANRKTTVRRLEADLVEARAVNRRLDRKIRDMFQFLNQYQIQPRSSTEASLGGADEFWNELWRTKEECFNSKSRALIAEDLVRCLESAKARNLSKESARPSCSPLEMEGDMMIECETGLPSPAD